MFEFARLPAVWRRPRPKTLDSFFLKDIGAYAIAPLPRNLRMEAQAMATVRGRGTSFGPRYVEGLGLAPDRRHLFETALLDFLVLASNLFPSSHWWKRNALHPWRVGLFFVADSSINASVRLSIDKRQNTAFIFINVGTVLTLLHQHCALMAVPDFFESLLKGEPTDRYPIPEVADIHGTSKYGDWLAMLPSSSRKLEIALSCTLKAAASVLCHELAHFLGGHLAYLESELNFHSDLREIDDGSVASPAKDHLPADMRRLLELHADELAGALSAVLWRDLDHPASGPPEARNEAFLMELQLATVCRFLAEEDCEVTPRYYSPMWRAHHFLQPFYRHFFAPPVGMRYDDPKSPENDLEVFKSYLSIVDSFERAEKILGWGEGFSSGRFKLDTDTLLEVDSPALRLLKHELATYAPVGRSPFVYA